MNDGQALWRLSGAHRHLVERFRPRHATPAPWGEQEHTADGTGRAQVNEKTETEKPGVMPDEKRKAPLDHSETENVD